MDKPAALAAEHKRISGIGNFFLFMAGAVVVGGLGSGLHAAVLIAAVGLFLRYRHAGSILRVAHKVYDLSQGSVSLPGEDDHREIGSWDRGVGRALRWIFALGWLGVCGLLVWALAVWSAEHLYAFTHGRPTPRSALPLAQLWGTAVGLAWACGVFAGWLMPAELTWLRARYGLRRTVALVVGALVVLVVMFFGFALSR